MVGEVISGTTIERMPLNGRNFSQLSLLLPGVITTEPDSFTEPKNFGAGPAVRQRPARAGEQLHARRRRHERADRQPAALPAEPRRAGRGARGDQQLLGRVRQRGRRGDRQHHQVGHQRVPRQRLRVLARQQHGREHVGEQPCRRRARRSCSSTSSAARSAAPSCGTRCSSSATTRRSSATVPASWCGRWRRRRGVAATSRACPTSSCRIRRPGSRSPATASTPSRFSPVARAVLANQQLYPLPNRPGNTQQPRGAQLRQAAHLPGRREGRREPVDQRPHVRPLLLSEVQVRAGTRAAREQPHRHQRRAVPGPGVQLDAHAQPDDAERAAGRLQQGRVRDGAGGLGGHRRRERDDWHSRGPADPRPERVQHQATSGSATPPTRSSTTSRPTSSTRSSRGSRAGTR